MRILIADDEIAVCSIFDHHLKRYSSPYIESIIVNDGKELIEKAVSLHPDLVITDIKMPNIDGIAAIEELRNLKETNSTAIYVLSGYTDFELVRKALKLGVSDYIPKPIKYLQFENLLKKEEEKRFLGLNLEDAYKLSDETLAINISLAIQELNTTYLNGDTLLLKKAIEKFKVLSDKYDIAISKSFFESHFGMCDPDRLSELSFLFSLVSKKNLEKESINLIEQIKFLVEQSFNDSLFGLDSVASTLGYNTQYLSFLFKKETGENFSQHLTNYRLNYAKYLLASTDMKIKDVATSCGYNYTNYFIKVFNRNEGMAPVEWRRQHVISN